MNKNLQGQVVLVTGAGSGIGRAIAVAFADEKARLVLCDVSADPLNAVVAGIKQKGGTAIGVVADVSKTADVQEAIASAKSAFGGVDILCNVAGINDGFAPVHEMSDDTWGRVIEVNLTGAFRMTREVLPLMIGAKCGVIINIASVASFVAIAGPAYAASKHGLIGLTKSVAATYREDGIRCLAICPGSVRPTNLSEGMDVTSERAKRRRAYRANRPAPANPGQIADVVVFAASAGGSYINGSSIVVDGGFLAS